MDAKLNEIDKKISKILDKIKHVEEANREINNNTIVLNDKLEHISKELEQLKNNNAQKDKDLQELRKSNDFLLSENKYLKNEMKEIRKTTDEMIYSLHASELDIIGAGNISSENLKESIIYASNKWKVPINNKDITGIEKKQMKSKNEWYFRVKFSNERNKMEFMNAAKKSKNKRSDMKLSETKQFIFFNEVLPNYSRKLLYYARNLKKDEGWRFVWTKYGRIYVRKDEKAPAILITSIEDIETLKNKPTNTK